MCHVACGSRKNCRLANDKPYTNAHTYSPVRNSRRVRPHFGGKEGGAFPKELGLLGATFAYLTYLGRNADWLTSSHERAQSVHLNESLPDNGWRDPAGATPQDTGPMALESLGMAVFCFVLFQSGPFRGGSFRIRAAKSPFLGRVIMFVFLATACLGRWGLAR